MIFCSYGALSEQEVSIRKRLQLPSLSRALFSFVTNNQLSLLLSVFFFTRFLNLPRQQCFMSTYCRYLHRVCTLYLPLTFFRVLTYQVKVFWVVSRLHEIDLYFVDIVRNTFCGHSTQHFLWTLVFCILFENLYASYFVEMSKRDNLFSEQCLINHSLIFTMCQTRSVTKVTSYRVRDTEGFCSFLDPGKPALHQTSY